MLLLFFSLKVLFTQLLLASHSLLLPLSLLFCSPSIPLSASIPCIVPYSFSLLPSFLLASLPKSSLCPFCLSAPSITHAGLPHWFNCPLHPLFSFHTTADLLSTVLYSFTLFSTPAILTSLPKLFRYLPYRSTLLLPSFWPHSLSLLLSFTPPSCWHLPYYSCSFYLYSLFTWLSHLTAPTTLYPGTVFPHPFLTSLDTAQVILS